MGSGRRRGAGKHVRKPVPAARIEVHPDGGSPTPSAQEQLRAIVANAPIVLFAVDREGIFTLSQGRGLEALGITPDGHVGQSYFTLYGHLPESVASIRQALAGEPATTLERFRGMVFETRWTPTRDADGTVTGVIGVSADVTARSRAEEERDALLHRERQARAEAAERAATLAATFDAMSDGVLIYDRDGRLVHANAAAHTTNAWSARAGYRDLPFAERVGHTLPRDAAGRPLAPEEWPVSRVLRGEVLTGNGASDTLVRQPDGQDIVVSVSGAPIRDPEGRIVGGVVVDRDVTERRRLERRTRESLDALLKVARILVRIPDEDDDPTGSIPSITHRLGVLTREVLGCRGVTLIAVTPTDELRPLECVGLSPEQSAQWRDRITNWPRHTPLFKAFMARLRAGETLRIDTTHPEQQELENPFAIGWYLVAPMRVGSTLMGLLSAEYGRGGAAVAREDIALVEAVATLTALVLERERLLREREEARASTLALREATRRMDEFLSIASHELRTPLTGLGGSLQIMRRRLARAADGGTGDAPEALSRLTPFLERALRQNTILTSLVDDLLDLSRIQAGRLRLRLASCDLVSMVTRTIEDRSLLDPARAIVQELPPAPILVEADAGRLSQVVQHYLDNALKYSLAEQVVTVGVSADNGMARVWVRDLGPGIPAVEHERIWGRFYRATDTEHRSGSSVGLGLGLYLSRGIIERHGGQTGVESEAGSGATFWFRLPLAAPGGALPRFP